MNSLDKKTTHYSTDGITTTHLMHNLVKSSLYKKQSLKTGWHSTEHSGDNSSHLAISTLCF